MNTFTKAIPVFKKNGKSIIVLRLNKDYLEADTIYIEESKFMQLVYENLHESDISEIGNNMNSAKINYPNIDVFVFINHGSCSRGRDMVAAVACLGKIKEQIMNDPSI